MKYGTSHFVSLQAAIKYYEPQEGKLDAQVAVHRKIKEGLISIGEPTVKPGQKLSIIPGEGRYQIED